ncbi:hypothetical protein GEMRC1_012703 [Eukaryota sp. GEM-RC1]
MFLPFFLVAVFVIVVSSKSTCSFEVNGKFYDLSLLGKNDLVWNKPYSHTQWYFRVCSPVLETCGSHNKAALCEKDDNGNHHSGGRYNTRTASSLPEQDTDGISITYKEGDIGCGGVARSTTVACFCDDSTEGVIEDMNEYPPCTYKMTVYSEHCCATTAKPMSASSPMIIPVLVIIIIIYFVGGFLYMFFVKKQLGTDAVPNVELWQFVGSLISSFFSTVAAKNLKTIQK